MSFNETGAPLVVCIHCESPRVAHVSGKVVDSFWMSMGGRSYSGYVPSNIGFGEDNDYIDFELCLDCTRMQKTGPIRYIAKVDAPRPRGVKVARHVPGKALPELQSMPAKWPGQCACGKVFAEGDVIDYSLTIREVVGCPICNAARAPKSPLWTL